MPDYALSEIRHVLPARVLEAASPGRPMSHDPRTLLLTIDILSDGAQC